MVETVIKRSVLETLAFSELNRIADRFGIEIPVSFNRNELITDILEYAEAGGGYNTELDMMDDGAGQKNSDLFPRPYNLTDITIVLRNPAWAFVYWNISAADAVSLRKAAISRLVLRISCFSEKEQVKPDDFFDFQVERKDTGQYVFIPAGMCFLRADLIFAIDGIVDILASSETIEMPHGSPLLADFRPGHSKKVSAILELSGITKLMTEMYKNHRESFCEV